MGNENEAERARERNEGTDTKLTEKEAKRVEYMANALNSIFQMNNSNSTHQNSQR